MKNYLNAINFILSKYFNKKNIKLKYWNYMTKFI